MVLASLQNILRKRLNSARITAQRIPGGCINMAYHLSTAEEQSFFIKINSASLFPRLFFKEANGLSLIAAENIISVPAYVDFWEEDDQQFLLMEWIEEGARTKLFWSTFGEQLAALHHIHHSYFGLPEDNYMGSIPQSNTANKSWIKFFVSNRLNPLVERGIAATLLPQNFTDRLFVLYGHLPEIFDEAPPSLLHGDLWSGNFLCNQNSQPVLIDPAAYFGHRSVDLGMTKLFGGFDKTFYESYHYHYPLPTNYAEQWEVCNLYPLLIHLLLFGTSYLPGIEAIVDKYC